MDMDIDIFPVSEKLTVPIVPIFSGEEEPRIPTISDSRSLARNDEIDAHFRESGFVVEIPNPQYARSSYRRLTLGEKNWVVAYKTDWRLAETHKLFIETWSSYNPETQKGRVGWAHDKRFRAFVIYSPQNSCLWWLPAKKIQQTIPGWEAEFGIRKIPNRHWTTIGVAVPEEAIIKLLGNHARQNILIV